MKRAAFLLSGSGRSPRRLDCLLNPSAIDLRRSTGLAAAASPGRVEEGRDPFGPPDLRLTGPGTTTLTLKLLFHTESRSQRGPAGSDVRMLTRPLWELSRAARDRGQHDQGLPRARFVWGRSWDLPVVVLALAERLDAFDADGTPRRAWVHTRLLVLDEASVGSAASLGLAPPTESLRAMERRLDREAYRPGREAREHVVCEGERLEAIADRYLGSASAWRVLAKANGLSDPLALQVGQVLVIPARSELPGVLSRLLRRSS